MKRKDQNVETLIRKCAFRLMAELGLRPIEVGYLKVKKDPTTKEFYWWCDYRKKSGGGTTEPRRVEPLPLINKEGKEQEWNLINRFKTNTLPLPDRVDGEACNTYLQRKESWKSLKKMMKKLREAMERLAGNNIQDDAIDI